MSVFLGGVSVHVYSTLIDNLRYNKEKLVNVLEEQKVALQIIELQVPMKYEFESPVFSVWLK